MRLRSLALVGLLALPVPHGQGKPGHPGADASSGVVSAKRPAGTSRDDHLLVLAWAEKHFLDAYRAVGEHGPKCAGAEDFIRGSLPAFAGLTPPTTWERVGSARGILRLECSDPVVLYFAARALEQGDTTSREASELYERAVAGMDTVRYPRGVARFAASGLRRELSRRGEGVGKREALNPIELRWFLESLTDGSYGPDDDVVLVRDLWEGSGWSMFTRNAVEISDALDRTPWVDPWVRSLVRGARYRQDAWAARGGDFADKVTPEGWKGFSEGLDKARKAYVESWRIRPDRPEAAAGMCATAMAESGPDGSVRLWFDRTVAAQFDYMSVYDTMINALRTRWGGDPDALVRFARECYETRRFDTDVPLKAFEALEQMEWDRIDEAARARDVKWWARLKPRPESIYRNAEVYSLVSAVLDGYLQGNARAQEAPRFDAIYAAVAYKAGRYEEARKRLRASGSTTLTPEAAGGILDDRVDGRIEAFGGSNGPDAVRAEELYQDSRLDEAEALFRKALDGASTEARAYLDSRLFAIGAERELTAGKSVAILPRSGLAGWTPIIGSWSTEPSGALVGKSAARGLLITCDARVGPDFEIALDIDVASTSNGQFQAGVVFGYPSWDAHDWTSFRVKRTWHEGEVAYFAPHFEKPRHLVKIPISEHSHVVVRSLKGRMSAWVNGTAVETDYAPPWESATGEDAHVGLGAYLDDNLYVVRHSNVVVRRLNAPLAERPAP